MVSVIKNVRILFFACFLFSSLAAGHFSPDVIKIISSMSTAVASGSVGDKMSVIKSAVSNLKLRIEKEQVVVQYGPGSGWEWAATLFTPIEKSFGSLKTSGFSLADRALFLDIDAIVSFFKVDEKSSEAGTRDVVEWRNNMRRIAGIIPDEEAKIAAAVGIPDFTSSRAVHKDRQVARMIEELSVLQTEVQTLAEQAAEIKKTLPSLNLKRDEDRQKFQELDAATESLRETIEMMKLNVKLKQHKINLLARQKKLQDERYQECKKQVEKLLDIVEGL